jgi:hypothetical protein
VGKWAEQIKIFILTVGTWVGLCTYKKTAKLKRAEWLRSLYEKFYEQPQYKKIRQAIDYETEDLQKIVFGIENGGETELLESFNDFLNFFEFIAVLWKLEQISLDEIRMIFEYYIRRMGDFDFILKYLEEEGFENLKLLINEFKKP